MSGEGPTDWTDYYEQQRRHQLAVEETIKPWPEIVAAINAPAPPVVRLLCPRGHRLLPVKLAVDHDGHLSVTQAAPARGGSPATVRSDPLETRRDRPRVRMCAEPTCNRTVSGGEDRCPAHGVGREESLVGRTDFDCGKCRYHGEKRPSEILKLYAVAVRYGMHEIRLPS